MKKPKIRELIEAIRSLFSKPYTTKFPKEPAEFPYYRGAPEFREEKCVGCAACTYVCPSKAIEFKDEKGPNGKRIITRDYGKCIFCAMCAIDCLTGDGIEITNKYDLAVFDRKDAKSDKVEKELVYCEFCGEPVTTKEHLIWIAEREGLKIYANPNLYLHIFEKMGLIQIPKGKPEGEIVYRSGLMKILCPKCRHQVMVKEEYY